MKRLSNSIEVFINDKSDGVMKCIECGISIGGSGTYRDYALAPAHQDVSCIRIISY